MENICDLINKKFLDKVAFIQNEKKVTYKSFIKSVDRLGAFLLQSGIKKGDIIAIFSTKDVYEIFCIFAAAKIGAVFININPNYKEDYIKHIIDECKIKFVMLNNENSKRLENIKNTVSEKHLKVINFFNNDVYIENEISSIDEIIDHEFPQTPICSKNCNNHAAIIYTSGSTGKPKGIIITHKILIDSTTISAEFLSNISDDVIMSITPFSFDGALSQLFTSLYIGATLVLQKSLLPNDIVKTMVNEKITGFHGMPSLWKMLLQKRSPLRKYEYHDLRYISIIGEPLSINTYNELKSVFSDTRICVMYGTTEAFRSTYVWDSDYEEHYPSVGKVIPGVELSIVDEEGNKCAPGEVGEIVHKGVFVSPGYWNDTDLTEQKFFNNSFYTGDVGYISEDGYLYLEGRKDLIVKVMGYRINLLEIEDLVQQISAVDNCIAGICYDENQASKIYVVVETSNNYETLKDEIIEMCKSKLQYFMVPSCIGITSELPKTYNYKVNRKLIRIEDYI